MRLIAIDSSTRRRLCCVAVTRDGDDGGGVSWDGRVLREAAVDAALPPVLAELAAAGVDAVAAVVGPGSRAGIRAGVAAGLGLVAAGADGVHPIGALDVVVHAWLADRSRRDDARVLWAVADASRGGLFVAPYSLSDGGARTDGGVRRLAPPRRVEASSWRLPHRAHAVALEGFDACPASVGVVGGESLIIDGLARAALAVSDQPVLDTAGLGGVGD